MTFGAGFLMRPLGAIFLGAYIDQVGRRQGLIVTLGIMALGTLLIAFVPGYATIGLLAPLLVLIGRLLQGFSAGVELGGVSVYLAEMATPGSKGFYVAWQSGSQQVAIMVAAVIGYLLNQSLVPADVAGWGWRIPFVIGCVIVPFLFYIRRSLQETEEFMARTHRPTLPEVFASLGAQLADRRAGHADGRHDHDLVLRHHRLYADLRQDRAQAVHHRQPDRDLLRRGLELLLAAGDGRAVRPDRPQAAADPVLRR